MNRTLAIIKPDAVSHPIVLNMVGDIIINSGFNISRACRTKLSQNQAEQLYSVHVGKFFYDRLITFMTSGPVLAMELQSGNEKNDVISEWRNLLGPSKLYANFMKYSSIPHESKPLRNRFAISDTRNLAHGSDSPEEVLREIAVFEPLLKPISDPYKLFELPNELKAITD
uniref:Nucleoside diphosphate kinase n=1 Tax=Panagrolaimus sp. PS1159 TaxID=55785 RepID=A0AC35GWQ1_9BILA